MNIMSSKKKLQTALAEVVRRLAVAVYVLGQIRNAPHPSEWTEEQKQKYKQLIDGAIAEAHKEL